MKKQIKKLSLNKKTISNLNAAEMNRQVGGAKTKGHNHTCAGTCNDFTCYTCDRTCAYTCSTCF